MFSNLPIAGFENKTKQFHTLIQKEELLINMKEKEKLLWEMFESDCYSKQEIFINHVIPIYNYWLTYMEVPIEQEAEVRRCCD